MSTASAEPLGRWTKTRAEIARTKYRDPDADVTELRRRLKAEVLADHIKRVVDDAPPLTEDQRAQLAALFRSSGGDAA